MVSAEILCHFYAELVHSPDVPGRHDNELTREVTLKASALRHPGVLSPEDFPSPRVGASSATSRAEPLFEKSH
jgi:hypothetical protein